MTSPNARRNEREAEARARQQAAVAELSRLALREVDLPAFFHQAAELVTRVLAVDRTGIGELLPCGKRLLIREGVGFPPGVVGHAVVDNWHVHAKDEEHPLLVPDMRKVLDYDALPHVGEAAISAASAVIHDGARAYGTLAVLSTVLSEISPSEEQIFLQTVADLLSTVVEKPPSPGSPHARWKRVTNELSPIRPVWFTSWSGRRTVASPSPSSARIAVRFSSANPRRSAPVPACSRRPCILTNAREPPKHCGLPSTDFRRWTGRGDYNSPLV